ncbi:MAG: hypothetical protein RMH74_05235, partial [Candidatus Caldarchaeum sp.]|nr:hypothetical protein [Candidatus Caldarchaeum sp.]
MARARRHASGLPEFSNTLLDGLRRCVLVLLPPGPDTVRRIRRFGALLREPCPPAAPPSGVFSSPPCSSAGRPAAGAPTGCPAPACSPSRVEGRASSPA